MILGLFPEDDSGLCACEPSPPSESQSFSPSWDDVGLCEAGFAVDVERGGCRKLSAPVAGGTSGRPNAKVLLFVNEPDRDTRPIGGLMPAPPTVTGREREDAVANVPVDEKDKGDKPVFVLGMDWKVMPEVSELAESEC